MAPTNYEKCHEVDASPVYALRFIWQNHTARSISRAATPNTETWPTG